MSGLEYQLIWLARRGMLWAGRVPAMLNGCVGIKPTVGRVSTKGVVPACRALDCISCFARCVDDGALVVSIMEVHLFDPHRTLWPSIPAILKSTAPKNKA